MNRSINRGRIGVLLLAALTFVAAKPSRAWCSGSGFLWVGIYDNDCNANDDTCSGIEQYSPSELKKNGSPAHVIGVTTFDEVYGNAFDSKHNLWEVVYDDTVNPNVYKLVEFTAAQLKKLKSNPNPTPAVIITSGSFDEPNGIAFDHNGNLWVGDCGGAIYEFSTTQLASSGAAIPLITDNSSDLDCPEFPIFDSTGNVWVSNYSGATLTMFTPSELTGNQNPGVIISDDGSGSIDGPGQLGFDPQGNLWMANYHDSNVEEFTKAQIASSGNPTPMVNLTSNKNSFDGPWGLVFIGGNLIVGNYTSGTISKFVASQLHASGSPKPKAFLSPSAIPTDEINQLTAGPRF